MQNDETRDALPRTAGRELRWRRRSDRPPGTEAGGSTGCQRARRAVTPGLAALPPPHLLVQGSYPGLLIETEPAGRRSKQLLLDVRQPCQLDRSQHLLEVLVTGLRIIERRSGRCPSHRAEQLGRSGGRRQHPRGEREAEFREARLGLPASDLALQCIRKKVAISHSGR